MKTCEQVAADVLKRRDAYLEQRAIRRRQVKRYTVAAALVCAAVFAAAGLYRSGLLSGAPSGSLPSVASDGGTTENDAPLFVTETTSGLPEGGTGAGEPTALPSAEHTAEPTSGDSAASVGGSAARAGRPANTAEEPGTAAEPATRQSDRAQYMGGLAEDEPTRSPDEPDAPGGSSAIAGSPPPATEKNNGQQNAAPPPTEPTSTQPSTEPNAAPPSTGPDAPEETETQPGASPGNGSATYLIYNGGLYAMGDGMTIPIPEEAEVVGRRTVIVLRGDEAVQTEALILSCPSEPQQVRTAVAADDGSEMCLMEYLGTVEELLQEDAP